MNLKSSLILFVFSLFIIIPLSDSSACDSHLSDFEKQKKLFPEFYKSLEQKNLQLAQENAKLLSRIDRSEKSTGKRIIPVVVHVIHNFGNENVTDAQIKEAIAALNKNINGQDPKFVNRTPDVFAAVVG